MKNSRLFEILYLLVEKQVVTAGELAQRLEVSERTIYRDIDALSAAGIPVFTQQGQGGGIRLMDQFVLDKALLSQTQQDEILFALQAVLAAGGGLEDKTLAQLTALFHREGGDWLEVDFTDWGSGAAERETFALVKGAILHLLQLGWGRKPSDCGARPSGVQEWVLVSVGLLPNPAGLACLPLGTDGETGLRGGKLPTPASPETPGVTVSQRGTRSESAAAVPAFCRLEGAGLLPPKTNHTGARWPLAGGLQFSRRPVAAFFPAFFWEPVGGTVSQVLAGYSYPRGQKIFGGL